MNMRQAAEEIFNEQFGKVPEITKRLSVEEKDEILGYIEKINAILLKKMDDMGPTLLDSLLAGLGVVRTS